MSESSKPRVLIIDDESEAGEALLPELHAQGIEATYRSPKEIDHDDLSNADLVLMDLDIGSPPESEFISMEPPDGLALASILRQQAHIIGSDAAPTGFALLSGKLDRLSAPFPPQRRPHLLARHHNLEWVFLKSDPARVRSIASLAFAIHAIPSDWAKRDSIA